MPKKKAFNRLHKRTVNNLRRVKHKDEEPVPVDLQVDKDNDEEPVPVHLQVDKDKDQEPVPVDLQVDKDNDEEPVPVHLQVDKDNDEEPVPVHLQVDKDNDEEPVPVHLQVDKDNDEEPVPVHLQVDKDNDEEPVPVHLQVDKDKDQEPVPVDLQVDKDNDEEPVPVNIRVDKHNDEQSTLGEIQVDKGKYLLDRRQKLHSPQLLNRRQKLHTPQFKRTPPRKQLFPKFPEGDGITAYVSPSTHPRMLPRRATPKNLAEVANPKVYRKPEGRRIFSISSLEYLLNVGAQHRNNCAQGCVIQIVHEIRTGLSTKLIAKCSKCKVEFPISNDRGTNTLPVNEAAVWATTAGATGYSSMKHIMTVMDIPFLSFSTFSKIETGVFHEDLMKARDLELKENGEEEKRLAIERGQMHMVKGEPVPWTEVFGDGAWPKRSYNGKGNSLSGSAVLIGMLSQKPLFAGVRNRYCFFCSTHENPVPEHLCFKNWDSSATAMEADIMTEGFKQSMEYHRLIYKRVIADGDSSAFFKLNLTYHTEEFGYLKVEKIECKNHAVRRMNRNLEALLKGNPQICSEDKKKLKLHAKQIGKYVAYAIEHNRVLRPVTNPETLKKDILNCLHHSFGDHMKCSSYLCVNGKLIVPEAFLRHISAKKDVKVSKPVNLVPTLIGSNLWKAMTPIVNRTANLSNSLIYGITTNIAESFQSQIAKFVCGKRTWSGNRGGFVRKVATSLLAFTNGPTYYDKQYRLLHGKSPSGLWTRVSKAMQRTRARIRSRGKQIRKRKRLPFTQQRPNGRFFSKSRKLLTSDEHYGENANRVDMDDESLRIAVQAHIASLKVTKEQQKLIARETVGQFSNNAFVQRRKFMLTASRAQEFANMKDFTPNVSKLDSLFEPKLCKTEALAWGQCNESNAIRKYESITGCTVVPCGIFVSTDFGGLGATPDGLVGEHGIIEVKCPFIEREGNPTDVANRSKKNDRFIEMTRTGEFKLNTKHKYYDQVVMQLNVTERDWCDFVVWTQSTVTGGDIFVTRIHRASTVKRWEEIRTKLIKFYTEDFAPEIVDSCFERNLEYRQPPYRMEAIRERDKRLELNKRNKPTKRKLISTSSEIDIAPRIKRGRKSKTCVTKLVPPVESCTLQPSINKPPSVLMTATSSSIVVQRERPDAVLDKATSSKSTDFKFTPHPTVYSDSESD